LESFGKPLISIPAIRIPGIASADLREEIKPDANNKRIVKFNFDFMEHNFYVINESKLDWTTRLKLSKSDKNIFIIL